MCDRSASWQNPISLWGWGVFDAPIDGGPWPDRRGGCCPAPHLVRTRHGYCGRPAAIVVVSFLRVSASAASGGGGGLRVSRRPGEPGAERVGQPGDRLPRGPPADLPGEPGAGEASRDDVRVGGDRGQAVLDVADR